MPERNKADMLLGKQTPVIDEYSPQVLFPIPRKEGRGNLGLDSAMPMAGADLWHAYEMSWLDSKGKPVVRVGRFTIPSDSPNMVESKSFKLYLNSLNNIRFDDEAALRATIERDLATTIGAEISLDLLDPADPSLAGATLQGQNLDSLDVSVGHSEPGADMILVDNARQLEERLYSHLLRSLCPVTGQPDWASVWLHYRGAALDHAALLTYLIAYRQHQEFHEQCVERMFQDIYHRCCPEFLHIQAFYTRRGGLDINPFRSTDPAATPLPRLNRQ
jgi:7-cyano-7-deazaguanine reductase